MAAALLLEHARCATELRRESPLAALDRYDLKRSWSLADLFGPEACVLWHLLLAWELKDKDRSLDSGTRWSGYCKRRCHVFRRRRVNRRLFYSLKPAVRMNMSSGTLQYLARRRWLSETMRYFMDSGDFVVAARIASKISRLADKAAALAK